MINFRNKSIIRTGIISLFCALALLISGAFRQPFLDSLRNPLIVLELAKREIKALIFFHHNYVENQQMHRDLSVLSGKVQEAKECIIENVRLRNLLSLKERSTYLTVASRVIGRSPDNWHCAVIIDKGKKHGIKRGNVVINTDGLVGRVIEVTYITSKVLLVNDPEMGVSAMIQRSRHEGLISGSLSATLMLKYLNKETDVIAGDEIITSGLTEVYPKGILIGKVTEVVDEPTGMGRFAIVKPAANLEGLEELLIILS